MMPSPSLQFVKFPPRGHPDDNGSIPGILHMQARDGSAIVNMSAARSPEEKKITVRFSASARSNARI